MKKLLFAGFFLLTFLGQAQETSGTQITVTIPNVPGNEGKVIISLYDEETFMKALPLQNGTSEIKDGKATFTFKEVPAGEYGIISIHDENNNDRIDMEPTGMPTEAYGVSNNPMSFGPPQWSEARFEVSDEPISLEIRF
ncbi:MAG TPA: DUF2141 domain-containing protein [Salinimicrobium catena]|uniref:DUF2141 domain-containing protein n=1 Tax=Salinimicrobium catena TaxID=390640 RepID=A0A7C2R8B0_9FLAO|nr:DUF2141 domain-containing protein [Salinimicrobium catena]